MLRTVTDAVYLVDMRFVSTVALAVIILSMHTFAQTPAELAELWEKEHVSKIFPSNMRHRNLLPMLEDLKKLGAKVETVGASYAGRSIHQIEWGKGPLKVFMWSQMHGDEPTATPALIDMFTILQKNREKEWVKRIEEKMTIRAVPMLNPDGAELFIRRNLQGIDINRDARDLKTPEAQLLKRLREEWSPDIGFNLHNQNSLTAAGRTNKQAAISFLVVYGDAAKTDTDGQIRNKRLVGVMNAALNQFIPGHIGRYGDEWTPSAFGDSFSEWGTPTILIETGGLHGKDEMYLVKMNFIAFVSALASLADGSERNMSPANYDLIPNNSGGRIVDIIFRNATIIDPAKPEQPTIGDIALVRERRREEFNTPTNIRRIGDLGTLHGLDEYEASGFNIVGRFMPAKTGNQGELLFYKKGRTVDWSSPELEKAFPPDAIFSVGRWVIGEGTVPKR